MACETTPMHSFILLGDDIYTLDTKAEREHAAAHMRDAGVARLPVHRGGPDGNSTPEGRDLTDAGLFCYEGYDDDGVCRYCDRGNKVCTCL